MQKTIKCTIFNTKWGYFGLASTNYALCGTCLPLCEPEKVESHLLKNLSLINRESSLEHSTQGVLYGVLNIELDKTCFKTLQEQITAYFDGSCVNFSQDIPIVLDGFSSFCSSVLTACRDIEFGQTLTYGQLAKKSGRPNARRAAGNALARNPLPLIIPCHRIIRSDGKLGGFSAPGGITLKKKMLELECQATRI